MIGHLAHGSTTLEPFFVGHHHIISATFSLNWILPGYHFFALGTFQGALAIYLGDSRTFLFVIGSGYVGSNYVSPTCF